MKRRAIALGIGALAVYSVYRVISPGGEEAAADPSLVGGRFWVDSRPEKHADHQQSFYVSSYGKFGFFEKASSYEFHLEQVQYRREGNKLWIHFPQTRRDAEVTFTVERCDELKPYDLCLNLSANPWGTATKFYGFSREYDEAAHLGELREAVLARAKALPPPK